MSEQKHNQSPYKNLGFHLKRLRESLHQSLAEVSGAVEIDPDNLAKIEQGEHRPSEDVLLLLISHLDPKEEEAVRLWELAGYEESQAAGSIGDEPTKPIVMLMQPDNRIMYSDVVNVVANNQGLVMNFLQAQGSGQAMPIARVGMSKEQALRVFEALGQTLQYKKLAPKALPAPDEQV
jgi:transcriptional regulator with XRE-family HTH domain